jgi:hypothetical protein
MSGVKESVKLRWVAEQLKLRVSTMKELKKTLRSTGHALTQALREECGFTYEVVGKGRGSTGWLVRLG